MARTKIGQVSILPCGDYDSTKKYERLSVVLFEGSSYIAIKENQGQAVTNTEYWYKLTEKGDKGDTYEVTKEDLEAIANEITSNANSAFNQNVTSKTNDFNTNAEEKTTAFNENATDKTNTFDTNAGTKTTAFNENATTKTNEFNTNSTNKTTSFNENATTKTTTFDENVVTKTNEFNENSANKLTEYNENSAKKTEEFNANAEKIEKELDWLKSIQDTQVATGENVYFDNAKNYPLFSLVGSGKSVQEAEPTPENPQEIKTITEVNYRGNGKNLLDYVGDLNANISGLTNTLNTDGSITTTGVPKSGYSSITKTIDITDILVDGEKYFISQEKPDNYVYIEARAKNKTTDEILYFHSKAKPTTFTVNKTLYTYDIRVLSSNTTTWGTETRTITNKYMLCKGKNTTFEPYQESTLPIDLQGNELASVGSVSDKLLIDRKGNVAIEKNVGKIVIDETNTCGISNNMFMYSSKTTPKLSEVYIQSLETSWNITPLVCDYYIGGSQGSANSESNKIGFSSWGDTKFLYFPKSYNTVEEFKAWLAENSVTVYYQLATPQIIELGKIENPEIFKGINNIEVSTNLGNMAIEVEYVEDLEVRISKLEQAFVAMGGI